MAGDPDFLRRANIDRAERAGPAAAARARRALERLGESCPQHYRRVALARIDSPLTPWSEIAETLGLTKDQATGIYRRLLAAARGLDQ